MVGTMKTKFQINDKVILPEGFIGVIKAQSPVGEYMVEVQGQRPFFYYSEDLEHCPKQTAGEQANNMLQREEE